MTAGPVLVTGAAGFLGRAVAEHLRAAGREVRGVDVAPAGRADVAAGDVSAPGEWQRLADGCDLVVHTAAVVSNVASLERAWRVNVLGTRRVLDAAAEGGVGRVVHFSSVAVYSHRRPEEVDERSPVRPSGDVYGDTKIAAEAVALAAHAAGEVPVTVVRPGDVYGPGSRPWTVLPVEMLRTRQVVLPARGRGVFVPVYVDDLVEAVVRAAEVDAAAGQVFNVTGGRGVETREFFGRYSRMLGLPPPPTLPTPAAIGLAAVLGATQRALGRPSEVCAATMRMLSASGGVSIAKAARVLGWAPRIDLDEGMRRTEAWLRAEGRLRRPAAARRRGYGDAPTAPSSRDGDGSTQPSVEGEWP